jgi:hypothetical protein
MSSNRNNRRRRDTSNARIRPCDALRLRRIRGRYMAAGRAIDTAAVIGLALDALEREQVTR